MDPSLALFHQNLNYILKKNPRLAVFLDKLVPQKYQWANQERFFNLQSEKGLLYSESPFEEAEKWFNRLELSGISALYVFGVGLGYYYEALKPWLHKDKERRLIFLEDDPEILFFLLHTPLGKDILEDSQVELQFLHDVLKDQFTYERVSWLNIKKKIYVHALEYYIKNREEDVYIASYMISSFASHLKSWESEFLSYGLGFYNNFYQNLFELPKSYLGTSLFDQFKNVPAIICAAGPSLNKQLPLLNSLKHRALIFAGGSALNILNSAGIQPHFGIGVDPNAGQLFRLSINSAFEVPFFYILRLFNDAFLFLTGPNLYLKGKHPYPIMDWLEERFNLTGKTLDIGHNVVNFNLAIAAAMGCNPLIIIGSDLAYSEDKTYAEGIERHPLFRVHENPYELRSQTERIIRNDIYGNPVYTKWTWITESEYISNFAMNNPDHLVLNATEGGIGFSFIRNIPFKNAIETFMNIDYDFEGKIHELIQKNPLGKKVTSEEIFKMLGELSKSLEKSIEHLFTISKEFHHTAKRISEQNRTVPDIFSAKAIIEEYELGQETAFYLILHPLDYDFAKMQISKVSKLRGIHDPVELQLSSLKILQERVWKLIEAAQVNLKSLKRAAQAAIANMPASREHPITPAPTPFFEITGETFVERYPNGALKYAASYKNGKLDGYSMFFYEKGQMAAYTSFKEGDREGEALFYYPSGAMQSQQYFRQDAWEGIQTYYFESGLVKTRLPFKKGLLEGDVEVYHSNGGLARKIEYQNGNRHGIEQMWNRQGNLKMEAFYEGGKPVKKAKYWSHFGNLIREVEFLDRGQYITRLWDDSGKLIKRYCNESPDHSEHFEMLKMKSDLVEGWMEETLNKLKTVNSPEIEILSEEFSRLKAMKEELTRLMKKKNL